jgi:hypothetical protein
MKPLHLLLLASLIHPAISGGMSAFGVLDSLIGVKGAPLGFIYDVGSAIFFFLNAPGILALIPWADTSFFHLSAWRVASSSVVIFLSWLCWTSIGFILLKAMLPGAMERFAPEMGMQDTVFPE